MALRFALIATLALFLHVHLHATEPLTGVFGENSMQRLLDNEAWVGRNKCRSRTSSHHGSGFMGCFVACRAESVFASALGEAHEPPLATMNGIWVAC